MSEEGEEKFEHPSSYNLIVVVISLVIIVLGIYFPKIVVGFLVVWCALQENRIMKLEKFQTKALEGKLKFK